MPVTTVLAVVCVSDLDKSRPWYEELFGRPADLTPMESLAEWKITDGGWLQVFRDTERAGSSFLTLAVDDLDDAIAELTARGVALEEIKADGNMITFGQKLKGH